MKTGTRVALSLAAGAGTAAFTYAGLAAAAWLRYGRHEELDRKPLLDGYMPEAEVIERHEIHVKAPAKIAFDAARNLDLNHSALVRWIFATRAKVMGAPEEAGAALPNGLIDQSKALGWRVLEDEPDKEVVIGAAAKPWNANPEFTPLERDQFAAFHEPGWVKIAWNFSVEPLSETDCVVRTETRVITTDPESRRRFRRYWAFASPGIILIRRLGLGIVKTEAEKKTKEVPAVVPA